MRIAHHTLPHDRMSNAGIGSDKDQNVRLLKIGICIRRGIKAERLLISHMGRRHALPRIAVTMNESHSELKETAKKGHLFGGNLTRAQKRNRLRSILSLESLQSLAEHLHRPGPRNLLHLPRGIAQQRCGATIRCVERCQGFPAFRAGHAEIHRIVGIGTQIHRRAVLQMHIESAPGGAIPTHHRRGASRFETRRDLPQPERPRLANELLRQHALARVQEWCQRTRHLINPPGIRCRTTATKNT